MAGGRFSLSPVPNICCGNITRLRLHLLVGWVAPGVSFFSRSFEGVDSGVFLH